MWDRVQQFLQLEEKENEENVFGRSLYLCELICNSVLQISIKSAFYSSTTVARLANLETKCVENEKRPNISYRLHSHSKSILVHHFLKNLKIVETKRGCLLFYCTGILSGMAPWSFVRGTM